MFDTQINSIISSILIDVPQFNGNGYYIEKGKESFKFSDNVPFWFSIDFPEGENFTIETENLNGCTSYRAVASLRMVARFTGVNMCDAVETMLASLIGTNLSLIVETVSIDQELIMEELFEKKPKQDIQLMRILFKVIAYKNGLKCKALICDDNTC